MPALWDSPAWGLGVEGWLDKGREGPALISLCTSSFEVAESLAKVEARLERICECKSNSTLMCDREEKRDRMSKEGTMSKWEMRWEMELTDGRFCDDGTYDGIVFVC